MRNSHRGCNPTEWEYSADLRHRFESGEVRIEMRYRRAMSDIPISEQQSSSPEKIVGGLTPAVAAGIACIFTIVSGAVFLILEKKNQFVRFWAMQAVLLGLVSFAGAIVFAVAYFVLGHMPLIGGVMRFTLGLLQWAFQIAWFVAYVVCIVKAFSNQEWEIPWLGKIARQQLARISPGSLPPV